MAKPGPKPSCICGTCRKCRNRERTRERYQGRKPMSHLARQRVRESRVRLPSDPAVRAYLAGLMDGEGCITRYAQNRNWVVQIGMTDHDVIEWLASIGGTMRAEKRKPGHLTCYRWRLMAQNDVREFLLVVLPYLRVKRNMAVQAISEIGARQGLRADELLGLELATA